MSEWDEEDSREANRARLLARIDQLEGLVAGAMAERDALRERATALRGVVVTLTARVQELEDELGSLS